MAENENPSVPLANELEATFKDLQTDTVTLAIPGIFIASMLLFGLIAYGIDFRWTMVVGFALFLVGLALVYTRQRSFIISALLIITGSLGGVIAVIWWGDINAASCLFIIPAGLTTLLLGSRAGAGMAILCSLLLLIAPVPGGNGSEALRVVSLLAVWSTVGMIWLTLRPLLTAVEGAWVHYEESREFLRQAQNYQLQLKQTLDDLTDTNTQLTRLNQLANRLGKIAEDERHAKEQFVANVSHELRTPLNMIIGFCEMILKAPQTYGKKIPSNLLADLEVVLRNSQHLSSLIDDVLDLSQIEAGQMVLSKENSAVPEIIEAAAIAVRPLFESKGLYLKIDIESGLPFLYCDRTRIREVLLNLLSNAGRFTEKGGVSLRAWNDGNFILVSVADTGKGISEEDKSKLFKPFQQLDGSIRRKYGGTGLGLSISKNFVELHDGKMWVESQEGLGTTFFFRLPVEPGPALTGSFTRWFNPYYYHWERDHRPNLPPVDIRPRLVLLDSSIELERIMSRHMEHHEIQRVNDLGAGLAELARTPARALIINATIPEEIIAQLNKIGPLPYNTPAIICSIPTLPTESDRLGVAYYLVKPVSRDRLLKAIKDLKLAGKTLLVVDDEVDAQQLFTRMLNSAGRGYRVLRAGNGLEALDILKQETVDLILLDWIMPQMNGIQFLAEKSLNLAWSQIPVILISAHDPQNEPVSSHTLAITRGGGLSIQQLLTCFDALSQILSPFEPAPLPEPALTARG